MDGVRARVRQVATWALAHGHPLDRDALAVVLATRADHGHRGLPETWTSAMIERLLEHDVAEWCARRRRRVPSRVAESLFTYLAFLFKSKSLDRWESEPIASLKMTLRRCGGLDGRGRQRVATDRPVAEVIDLGRAV